MSIYESELNTNHGFMPGSNAADHQEPGFNHRPGYDRSASAESKSVHRRRRWTHEDKKAIVAETEGPGASISGVARKYGIAPRLLFSWRRQLSEEMSLTTRSGAKIVPISMVRDLEKRIKELESQLEKKTSEVGQLTQALQGICQPQAHERYREFKQTGGGAAAPFPLRSSHRP